MKKTDNFQKIKGLKKEEKEVLFEKCWPGEKAGTPLLLIYDPTDHKMKELLLKLMEGLLVALHKTPEGKGITIEQVRTMLEGLDIPGRNEVAKNPAVRAEVLAVQVRRAQAVQPEKAVHGGLSLRAVRGAGDHPAG